MSVDETPIVVTGLGLVTALGANAQQTFDAILAGRCGIGPLSVIEQRELATKGGGEAVAIEDENDRGLDRAPRYLRRAIFEAINSAGINVDGTVRLAVVMGTTLHGVRAGGRYLRNGRFDELQHFPANAVLAQATAGLRIRGPGLSTCSACASGLGAVAMGVSLLRAGQVDAVIAGGFDVISEYAYAGFDSLRLIAPGPLRPFAGEREGMKTAEGYAAIVLERASDAQERSAHVRGCIAGYGETSDVHHLTQPHPQGFGAARAMEHALEMAGMDRDAVGLIAAHCTATPNNDASEYAAMRRVFGAGLASIPVVGFKSYLGHTLGGAGSVELVLSILAMEKGAVPATLNVGQVDAEFADLNLPSENRTSSRIQAVINTSLGFGGSNASVVTVADVPGRCEQRRANQSEAVITGVGIVLPGVRDLKGFGELIRSGEIGASGRLDESEIKDLLQARRVRRMSDCSKYTLAASAGACAMAGLEVGDSQLNEACAILGTTHGSSNFCEDFYTEVVRDGLGAGNPALFAEGVPNACAAQLSLAFGLHGGCQTLIGSRTAGLDALGLAAMRIEQGLASCVLVGASEEYCKTVCGAVMDQAAPGEKFGSGAIVLVVESQAQARARGASVLARIGNVRWEYGAPLRALARLLGRERQACIGAFGDSPLDKSCRALLDRRAAGWRNLRPMLPEIFSVGGLCGALAAMMFGEYRPSSDSAGPSPLLVACDGWGGAVGIEVRAESTVAV